MGDRPRRQRTANLAVLAAVAALVAGCGLPAGERIIPAEEAETAVEGVLALDLTAAPPVEGTSVLADVLATYSVRTANERVLMIVFNSREATLQVRGRNPPREVAAGSAPLTVDNVVVFYSVDGGTLSRREAIQRALGSARQPE